MAKPQNSDFKTLAKIESFTKKVPNIGITPSVWLIEEENNISNIQSKFQDQTSNNLFSKWQFWIFSGGNHPPTHWSLTAYPNPRKGGTPILIINVVAFCTSYQS